MNTCTDAAVLEIRQLGFAYPDQAPLAVNWSTDVLPGITLLHGDTGSGKSTLLRVMAGVQAAGSGDLTVTGHSLRDAPAEYRREVYFVEPWTDAFDQVSGRDYGAALQAADARFDLAMWHGLVQDFALAPHLDKPLYMLSTGSKRKVWLAGGLASGRALILLDEPTGGLDGPSTRSLWLALDRLAAGRRSAVVMASATRLDQVALAAVIELPLAT